MTRSLPVLICAFLFLGCDSSLQMDATAPDHQNARAAAGSAEEAGILAFLNDASTTFELLDDDVALDRRAAKSITDYRNGVDRVQGTSDDRTYNTIAQVDARYYVGPAALNRLEDWAIDWGWVPMNPDDVLGTWDDVTFTVAEAEAVVELANTADPNTLDDNIGLDSRAADSIVDARPVSSVYEISGLYYVGASALSKLKDYAHGEEGVHEGEGEGENPGCLSDLEAEAVVAEILGAYGITELGVILPPDEVCAQQQQYDNLVSFSAAVEAAIVSFLSDDEDMDSPLARLEFVDGGPCLAGDPSDRIRCFMDRPDSSFELIGPQSRFPPEHRESLDESWSFYLSMDSLSDHLFWAIVDRSGAQPAYNYGFN
jgi:hypothetical protein